jgi:hypothetical protein
MCFPFVGDVDCLWMRLTWRAPTQERRDFKATMWALITSVIAIIEVYQTGILLGTPIEIYKADGRFLILNLLPKDWSL